MPAYGLVKDSPIITAVQKASRKSRKKGRHMNGGYMMLSAKVIAFPFIVLNAILDRLNAKLESYIESQRKGK